MLINKPNPGCCSFKSRQIYRWITISLCGKSSNFYHTEIKYAPSASYTLKEEIILPSSSQSATCGVWYGENFGCFIFFLLFPFSFLLVGLLGGPDCRLFQIGHFCLEVFDWVGIAIFSGILDNFGVNFW